VARLRELHARNYRVKETFTKVVSVAPRTSHTHTVDLAGLLETERLRRDWSQAQAGKFFKVSQQSYGNWESGKAVPPEGRRTRIAQFLGIAPEAVPKLSSRKRSAAAQTARLEALEAKVAHIEDLVLDLHRRRR